MTVRSKQRVLIMEGPDRCGKTNIGQALSKYYRYACQAPYFKVTSEADNWRKPGGFKNALEYDQTYIAEFLEQTGHGCVIDRAYPSEWVYSQVYERPTNDFVLGEVDWKFAKMGAVIILLTRHGAPEEWDDELIDRANFNPIKYMYDEFFNWTNCRIIRMCVDDYNCDIDRQLPKLTAAIDAVSNCPGNMKVRL